MCVGTASDMHTYLPTYTHIYYNLTYKHANAD